MEKEYPSDEVVVLRAEAAIGNSVQRAFRELQERVRGIFVVGAMDGSPPMRPVSLNMEAVESLAEEFHGDLDYPLIHTYKEP